jgi:hypothetical protein
MRQPYQHLPEDHTETDDQPRSHVQMLADMSQENMERLWNQINQQNENLQLVMKSSPFMNKVIYYVYEWNDGVLQIFLLWGVWIFLGTFFYASVNFDGDYAKAFCFSISVGYSIGWSNLSDNNTSSKMFSMVYLLFGASCITRVLTYLILRALNEHQEKQESIQERHAFQRYLYKNNPFTGYTILSSLYVYVTINAAPLLVIYLWVVYLIIGAVWSITAFPEWNFFDGLYFSLTAISTSGLTCIPMDSSDQDYIVMGVYTALGIPLMALAMTHIATLVMNIRIDCFAHYYELLQVEDMGEHGEKRTGIEVHSDESGHGLELQPLPPQEPPKPKHASMSIEGAEEIALLELIRGRKLVKASKEESNQGFEKDKKKETPIEEQTNIITRSEQILLTLLRNGMIDETTIRSVTEQVQSEYAYKQGKLCMTVHTALPVASDYHRLPVLPLHIITTSSSSESSIAEDSDNPLRIPADRIYDEEHL